MAKALDETALGPRPAPEPSGGIARYRGDVPGLGAPGEALVAAGGQIGNEADKLFAAYKHEQQKVDTLRAEDAYTRLRAEQVKMTYGPGGYATRKGENAVLGPKLEEQTRAFQDVAKSIDANLANDDQRRMFRARAAIAQVEFTEGAARHLLKERNVWATQVTNAGVDGEIAGIAAEYSNPALDIRAAENRTSASIVRIKALIEAHADDMGLDRSAIDKTMRELTDKIVTTKLLARSSWDPVGAFADFKDHQTEISDPKDRLLLRNTLWQSAAPVQSTYEAKVMLAEARKEIEKEQGPPPTEPGTMPTGKTTGQAAAAKKLAILLQEFNNPETAKNRTADNTRELQSEIFKAYRQAAPAGGALVVREDGTIVPPSTAPDRPPERVLAPQTNPYPTARELAAQLPLALMKVEKRANELFGKDPLNPDRAAFIRLTEAEIRSQNAHDVQMVQAQQREALSIIGNTILGPVVQPGQQAPQGAIPTGGAGGGAQAGLVKLTSFSQLMADPRAAAAYRLLDYDGKKAVDAMLKANANESERGDPALFNELRNAIAEGRIHWNDQITSDPRVQAGNLNITQLNYLRGELERQVTEGGRTATATVRRGTQIARAIFQGDMILTNAGMDKGKAEVAEELFSRNAAAVVAQYRKEGKPVDELFDITNPKSLIYPPNLEKWKALAQSPASAGQALADQAARATAAAPPPVPMPATIKTIEQRDAWFKTLPDNQTTFTAPNGKTYFIPGRAQAMTTAPAAAEPRLAAVQPAAQAAPAAGQPATAAPPAPPKAKGELPKFVARTNFTEQDRAMHQQATLEALKAIFKAPLGAWGTAIQGYQDAMLWLEQQPARNREKNARAAFEYVLSKDTFSEDDVQVVRAAMKWGNLGPYAQKKAKALLKAAGEE